MTNVRRFEKTDVLALLRKKDAERNCSYEVAALRAFQKIEADIGAPFVGAVKNVLMKSIVGMLRRCYVTDDGMISNHSIEVQIRKSSIEQQEQRKRKKRKIVRRKRGFVSDSGDVAND